MCACNSKTLSNKYNYNYILFWAPSFTKFQSFSISRQLFLQFLLLLLYWKYFRWWSVDSKNWYKDCMTIIEGYEIKKWYWTNWILFLQIHFCLSTHVNSRSIANTQAKDIWLKKLWVTCYFLFKVCRSKLKI